MERFVSSLGNKDVMSIRVAKEIKLLISELAACNKELSQGEIVEAALYLAFNEGLLCKPTEQKRIKTLINSEITEKVTKF